MTVPSFSYPLRTIPYRDPIGLGAFNYRREFWDKTNTGNFSDGAMTQEYRLMDKAWSAIDLPELTAEQAARYLHLLKSVEADPVLEGSTWEGMGIFGSGATGVAKFGHAPSYDGDNGSSGDTYYFDSSRPDLATRVIDPAGVDVREMDEVYRQFYPNDNVTTARTAFDIVRSRTFLNGHGVFEAEAAPHGDFVFLSNFTGLSLGLIENGEGVYKPILGYLLFPSFSGFGPSLGQYDYNLSAVAYVYREEIAAASAAHIAAQQALAEANEWWDIFIHYPAVQTTSLSIAGITLPLARIYTRQQYYAREDEDSPYEIQWDTPFNYTSELQMDGSNPYDPPPIPVLSSPEYYDPSTDFYPL